MTADPYAPPATDPTTPSEPTPVASRPYMPGYGVAAADEGAGLLPWSHAVERLTGSRNYWMATVSADGRPHVTPVWGVWQRQCLWFSCSPGSRKARNLRHDTRATATTDNAYEPVVIEGEAHLVTDPEIVAAFAGWVDAKYETDYGVEFYAENCVVCLRPGWVFALVEADFIATPTRWTFDAGADGGST